MQQLGLAEIAEAVKGIIIAGSGDEKVFNISTDSRKIAPGDLFVPIEGEKFDGHNFIGAALEAGAAAALTHKTMVVPAGKAVIRVEDTLRALGNLAAYYRQRFDIPFVGITGSVGKTSTKDMIAQVLAQKFEVLKTAGNFNNEIGLPLTLFNLCPAHQAAVLEMGMSGFGEISRLTNIVKPRVAVITNIGVSHIEKLGSRPNILKAKLEILEGLDKSGLVVLNGDDSLLYGVKDLLGFRTVCYGMGEGLDYQAYNIVSLGENGTTFELDIRNRNYRLQVNVPGVHNVYNALAAVAAGIELGLSMEEITTGISLFTPGKMRQNIIDHEGVKIINDAYNASPQSMEAALNVLRDVGINRRKIAVLGDMLEMGEWALDAHLDVGKFAVEKGIDYIVTVGQNGRSIAEGALKAGASAAFVHSFEDNRSASVFLNSFVTEGDVILIKGSRGMKMEEIVEYLTKAGR